MEQTIDTLKKAVAQQYNDTRLEDLPQVDRSVDVFENDSDATTAIRRDTANIGGEIKTIRRVFLRLSHSEDYRNIGWVVDADLNSCMLCGSVFGLFNRRSHCRVCGDLVCRACLVSEVRLKELPSWGLVPACDLCYYGQEEVAVKFPQNTQMMHKKIQRIQQLDVSGSTVTSTLTTSSMEKKEMMPSQLQQETTTQMTSEQISANDLLMAKEKQEREDAEARLAAEKEREELEATAAASAVAAAKRESAKRSAMAEAAKVKAEQEALAKAEAEKEAKEIADREKTEEEAAARLRAARAARAEVDAFRVKAEQDAAARKKASEEEARIRIAEEEARAEKEDADNRSFHLRLAEEAAQARANMEASVQEHTSTRIVEDGTPFSVLKLRDSSDNKIFVNVCSSDAMHLQDGERFVVDRSSPRRVQDKKGESTCLTYDVCVCADSVTDSEKENDLYSALVNYLNDNLDGSLSGEYSLPKIKGRFKGEHTPEFYYVITTPSNGVLLSNGTPQKNNHGEHHDGHNGDVSTGSDDEKFSGVPFAVLKVRNSSAGQENIKVFVNVLCVQDSVLSEKEVVIGDECPRTAKDKKGDTSTIFDVCVHSDVLESAEQQEQIFPALISLLNEEIHCDLSSEYTLPKIKSKFKGDHTAVFSSANIVPLPDGAVFDGSKAPERHFGPAKRLEGTLMKSFKQRFLLLQSGVLMVYKSDADYANRKEEMELIAFKASFYVVSDTNSKGKEIPPLSLCILDTEDSKFDIQFQFENKTDCQNWRHHIKQNLAYVEYKAAHLLF